MPSPSSKPDATPNQAALTQQCARAEAALEAARARAAAELAGAREAEAAANAAREAAVTRLSAEEAAALEQRGRYERMLNAAAEAAARAREESGVVEARLPPLSLP